MGKTTSVDRDTLSKIRHKLRTEVADKLVAADITHIRAGAFGGSTGAATLIDDATRAREHVVRSSHRTGQAVDHLASALDNAVKYVDESDEQAEVDAATINTSVAAINTKYDDPTNRRPNRTAAPGSTS